MIFWLTTLMALAGDVYVNDVHVNPKDLQGMTLEKVDVAIDANGNIRITAPGYKIQVVNPPPGATTATTTAPTPAPATHGYPPGAYGQPYGSAGAPKPVPKPGVAPLDPSVPAATWWLVTEDNGSSGHTLEVYVNGRLVDTVKSGEAQRILDVGSHIKRGTNQVTIKSVSNNPGGGSLYVYVGTGNDRSGTVVMDESLKVQFGIGSNRQGAAEKSFEFSY